MNYYIMYQFPGDRVPLYYTGMDRINNKYPIYNVRIENAYPVPSRKSAQKVIDITSRPINSDGYTILNEKEFILHKMGVT